MGYGDGSGDPSGTLSYSGFYCGSESFFARVCPGSLRLTPGFDLDYEGAAQEFLDKHFPIGNSTTCWLSQGALVLQPDKHPWPGNFLIWTGLIAIISWCCCCYSLARHSVDDSEPSFKRLLEA